MKKIEARCEINGLSATTIGSPVWCSEMKTQEVVDCGDPARRRAQRGSAFVHRCSRDLELIFTLQYRDTVNRDNTVNVQNLQLQIEPVRWRATLAGSSVLLHQHLDGFRKIGHGGFAGGGAPPLVRKIRPLTWQLSYQSRRPVVTLKTNDLAGVAPTSFALRYATVCG